jgi:cysteine desulfurase
MEPARGRVYLDHNATSPLRTEARAAIEEVWASGAANASSIHAEGRLARQIIERARAGVAALIGLRPREVVFTSGGTEAIATVFHGVCRTAPRSRRRIVVSAVEHSAVLEAARAASSAGFTVITVPCDQEGRVIAERFPGVLGDDVALFALQAANSETGVLQPVEEASRVCRPFGVPLLVDAVQAAGKVPVGNLAQCADFVAVSGHKFGGPQGTGALGIRGETALVPLVPGGAQERRRRAGTEAVAAIAGFGAAALAAAKALEQEERRQESFRRTIEKGLRAIDHALVIHGEGAPRLPNTVNWSWSRLPGDTLVIALDLLGFAVSSGSACASGAVEPSHVIRAMGFDEEHARGAIRVSTGWSTTADEVDRFLEVLPEVVARASEGLGDAPWI